MSAKFTPPSKLWAELKRDLLVRMAEIDAATPWRPTPPKWWLEMAGIRDDILRPNRDDPARLGRG